MAYEWRYSGLFQIQLDALSADRQEAVDKKVKQIREMPEYFDFLSHTDRVQKARVGKYRVFFRVNGNTIEFLEVRKRDMAYKR
jgi:mRNA-degrading endonuclease RelE of RelBE toxin-antitoxin system